MKRWGLSAIAVAGRRVVLTEPTGDDSRSFHGWLGRDLYRICDSLTIDYRRMNIALR